MAPIPLLCVVGRFEAEDEAALSALGWQVDETLRRLRPVGYEAVEQACSDLADAIVAHLGADTVRTCRIVGVPRGGLLVAALVAYALGASADQLERPPVAGETVIVVDDCVLSGARLRRWLRSTGATDVVVAHLHSHPDLRLAVERDPAVRRCLAATDVRDHAPQQQGSAYGSWRERWAQRSPDDFWTGHADHVCYPWNEPDTLVWNPQSNRAEPGWHVVPPAWCLKNRRTGSSRPDEVFVCPKVQALDLADEVVWVDDDDDGVVVVDAAADQALSLTGVAADCWRALVEAEDVSGAAAVLQRTYDVAEMQLRDDLDSFVRALRERGITKAAG
jgi:hypothetical protein